MPDSDSPATAIAAKINSFTLATLQAQDQLPDNQLYREAYHAESAWKVS